MDKKITGFIITERKIGKFHMAPIDILLIVFAPVFAMMIRFQVIGYTPSVTYSFAKLTESLKGVSIVFDLLLSLLVGIYVYRLTGHKIRAYLGYAIMLLLPVLCAGSAMWGMGDSIYIFFAVLSLFLLSEGKGNASLISYGISLFFSRYAFFLLPIYAIAFMQKKNKLIYFIAPVCGVWFRNGLVSREGKLSFSIFEAERLLTLTRGETRLSYNWPNIYQMIGTDKFVIEYGMVARCLVMALMLVIVVAALAKGKELKKSNLAAFAALLAMLIPFVMPQMDERSGLLADVLLVIVALRYTQLYYVAILHVIISYMAYSAFFRGESVVPFSYVAIVNLFLIVVMLLFVGEGRCLRISCHAESEEETSPRA